MTSMNTMPYTTATSSHCRGRDGAFFRMKYSIAAAEKHYLEAALPRGLADEAAGHTFPRIHPRSTIHHTCDRREQEVRETGHEAGEQHQVPRVVVSRGFRFHRPPPFS